MRILRSDLPKVFGPIVNGVWEKESINMDFLYLPTEIRDRVHKKRLYCNRAMIDPLQKVFEQIVSYGIVSKLDSIDGVFNIRASRTDSRQSVHSWGMAIDINAATNKLGTVGNMNFLIIDCFEDNNFIWGGKWKNPDPMHFQYVEED